MAQALGPFSAACSDTSARSWIRSWGVPGFRKRFSDMEYQCHKLRPLCHITGVRDSPSCKPRPQNVGAIISPKENTGYWSQETKWIWGKLNTEECFPNPPPPPGNVCSWVKTLPVPMGIGGGGGTPWGEKGQRIPSGLRKPNKSCQTLQEQLFGKEELSECVQLEVTDFCHLRWSFLCLP